MSERGRDGGSGEAPEPMAGEDLVALLYGELDPDEAARTGARVQADPALSARLGEMRRVRELFSAMEEEEPPGRLTAQLMAEAARSAPHARAAAAPAGAGIWARFVSWLQPLAQRPALAAAASLLLVAGVASVLYMRKGEELTSTAPPTTLPPAETTTAGEASATTPPPPVTAATPPEAEADEAGGQAGADDRSAAPAPEPTRKQRTSSPRTKGGGGAPSDQKKMASEKAPPRPTLKSGTVYGLSEQEMVPREEAPSGGAANQPAQQRADDEAAPAAQPAPAPQASSPAADGKASAPRPDARALHQRAIDAALDKRCDEVRALAGQVRSADPSYYAKSFTTDKRLQACLSGGSTKKATKK